MQLGLLGFKLTDDQSPPGLTGASQGGEHQLQPGPLAEGVRDHFGPSAFLAEQPLHQVGGSNGLAVSDGQAQVGDACLEIVLEAGDCAGKLPHVAVPELFGGWGSRASIRCGADIITWRWL